MVHRLIVLLRRHQHRNGQKTKYHEHDKSLSHDFIIADLSPSPKHTVVFRLKHAKVKQQHLSPMQKEDPMEAMIRVLSPHGRPTMIRPSSIAAIWINWDKDKMCVVKMSCSDSNLYFSDAMTFEQVGPYITQHFGLEPSDAQQFAADTQHYEETPRSFT